MFDILNFRIIKYLLLLCIWKCVISLPYWYFNKTWKYNKIYTKSLRKIDFLLIQISNESSTENFESYYQVLKLKEFFLKIGNHEGFSQNWSLLSNVIEFSMNVFYFYEKPISFTDWFCFSSARHSGWCCWFSAQHSFRSIASTISHLLVIPCFQRVVACGATVVSIKKFLEPLKEFEIVLESSFHQPVYWYYLNMVDKQ